MSNINTLVSIIINNFNYAHFLDQAIKSALTQTYSPIEIVVVDDGSLDDSRAVIESFGSQVIPVFKENGGQASAFNQGFAKSKGEIIFFLDSDDYFCPQKVQEIIQLFAEHEDMSWCFHTLKYIDDHNGSAILVKQEKGSKVCDFRSQIKDARPFSFHAPATSGLVFKRSLLEQILPMPTADDVNLSDLYLKTLAMGLASGYYLDLELAVLRVHGQNRYTQRTDKATLKAQIDLLTGYWIRKNFPCFQKSAHKMFLRGMRALFAAPNDGDLKASKVISQYISEVSPAEITEVLFRRFYYQIKLRLFT